MYTLYENMERGAYTEWRNKHIHTFTKPAQNFNQSQFLRSRHKKLGKILGKDQGKLRKNRKNQEKTKETTGKPEKP